MHIYSGSRNSQISNSIILLIVYLIISTTNSELLSFNPNMKAKETVGVTTRSERRSNGRETTLGAKSRSRKLNGPIQGRPNFKQI